MQPQFHRSRISVYAQVMVEHEGRWRDGAKVDMAQEMSGLTLHIVVKTLFGLELPDTVRRIGEAFELSNGDITVRNNQPPALRKLFHRWSLPLTRRFRRELAFLDGTVYDLIAQHRRSELEGSDLLSLLLNARYEQADQLQEAGMTDQQLRDEVITLFGAGHETTAVALTWTWYLLAIHPGVPGPFPRRTGRCPGRQTSDAGRPVEFVLHGTDPHRINASVPARLVHGAYDLRTHRVERLADTGRRRAGCASTDAAPRLPLVRGPARILPRPLDSGIQGAIAAVCLLPLGRGPRLCIGEGFAWIEALLVLAMLGQRWAMRHDPTHRVELVPLTALSPKGGMPMFLERRS